MESIRHNAIIRKSFTMQEQIQNTKNEALSQIMVAKSLEELESIRVNYLGRSGRFTEYIKQIRDVPAEDRRQIGAVINEAKQALELALHEQINKIKSNFRTWFDPTVPGIKPPVGHLHIITQAIEEITSVFNHIGFVRVRYPEVEWDWFAFGSLNFAKDHPARDDWETFFLDCPPDPKYGPMLLTPHTSNGQVRQMLSSHPPIRMINIAKCYRRQSDVSHSQMFHQFEGLVIDHGISIVNLKGTLDYFARNFFGKDRVTRLRPYHFPFTEPSFEVDITCGVCMGRGCKLCKEGWLELGGAGMVHPKVLENGKIDPGDYSGFAFGWGVERTYMMKQGLNIPDLRMLYNSDLRFLRQF